MGARGVRAFLGDRASTCPTRWSSTSRRWRTGSSIARSRRRAMPTASMPVDAVLAERPIYKGGQILRSWQKRFVQTCVEDWRLHGKARYLIADDVGLGKTLSMAAAALVLSLLDDKPVLILAPATLDLAVAGRAGRQARHAGGGLVDAEEVLARRRTPAADPEGRPDARRKMPLAHRHRVDRPDRQRRRRGRARRAGEEDVRRRDPRRGAQGAKLRAGQSGREAARTKQPARVSARPSPETRRTSFSAPRRRSSWRRWNCGTCFPRSARARRRCWGRHSTAASGCARS